MKPETWIAIYDLHYPKVDWPTVEAVLEFLKSNKVTGCVLGGDQFQNEEISHHNKGKGLYKLPGSYRKNTDGFNNDFLLPLERALGDVHKVWIEGNHDHWEYELIETHPELQGVIERPGLLGLEARGWQVVPMGESFEHGELTMIHGEQLSGIGNQAGVMHSRKALETYCTSVLYGHMHSPQSFTKVLPHKTKYKWQSWCAPIAGRTNPGYLENRPTAWLNGFVIIEFYGKGMFNLYPVNVFDGKFAYGGKVYGGK